MATVTRLGTQHNTRHGANLPDTGSLLWQQVEAVKGPFVLIQGQWVLNFVGTNYLGLGQHPALQRALVNSMAEYGLSLSMPRILATDGAMLQLEQEIARLVGQQRAMVFPSTTHTLLDLLPYLAGPAGMLFLDAWSYPISRQAAALARQRNTQVRFFAHNDVTALHKLLTQHRTIINKVIVCDGVYSAGGGQARVREFAELAQAYGAIVVVDDAHGLGVLGRNPTTAMPYGRGGGGVLLHQAAQAGPVIYVGSLSKAFSVPLAFAAGPDWLMTRLEQVSGAHTHSSPPARPIVAAARAVLQLNALHGNSLRARLLANVRQFRHALAEQGLVLAPQTDFPIQSLHFAKQSIAQTAARALRRTGIWGVMQYAPADSPADSSGAGVLRFIVTRLHTAPVLAQAAVRIAAVIERVEEQRSV